LEAILMNRNPFSILFGAVIAIAMLASSQAGATVSSSNFVVSITIEAPCGVEVGANSQPSALAVTCAKTTPYNLDMNVNNVGNVTLATNRLNSDTLTDARVFALVSKNAQAADSRASLHHNEVDTIGSVDPIIYANATTATITF
jgi:hypothetical protein